MKKLPVSILASPDEVFIPGAAFQYWDGAGSGNQSYTQGYAFPDQAGASAAVASFGVPPVWVNKPIMVDVFWRQAGTLAGTVYWQVNAMRLQDGSVHTSWTFSDIALLDAAQGTSTKTHVVSATLGTIPSNASELEAWTMVLYRRTDLAGDTFGTTAYLIGAKLRVRAVSNRL